MTQKRGAFFTDHSFSAVILAWRTPSSQGTSLSSDIGIGFCSPLPLLELANFIIKYIDLRQECIKLSRISLVIAILKWKELSY